MRKTGNTKFGSKWKGVFDVNFKIIKGKGKVIPLQTWCGPEGG